jgi:CubicO group peptidase (beta-lactamase class C family)
MQFRSIVAAACAALALGGVALAQVPTTVVKAAPAAAVSTVAPATPSTVAKLQPGQAIPPAELEAFVDGIVRDSMLTEHIEGVQVSVVQNGQITMLKGYGVANQPADGKPARPVDPSKTLFRIGSISKTFTWILLMREVDKGRVKLDDPVNKYLPANLQVPDEGFKKPIRVVDLMAHSAGFEDISAGHLFVNKPEKLMPAEAYAAAHRPHRVREPGTFSTYSNYSTALAAIIVQRLNKLDYQTLVERDILGPLRMDHSTFREPADPKPGLWAPMPANLRGDIAEGFNWGGTDFKKNSYEYIGHIAGVGAASTTAADMARYMQANLNGGTLDGATIYSPAASALFRTPVMDVPPGVNGWNHGFMAKTVPGGFKAFGHGGATVSFFSFMTMVPDLNLGIFVTTNTSTGRALGERVPAQVIARFYAPEPTDIRRAPDPAFAKQAANYDGLYLSSRRAYSGLEKFMGLMQTFTTVKVSPKGYLITAGGTGPNQTWVSTDVPGQFRAVEGEARLNFKLDDKGKAIRFFGASGTASLERVGGLMNPGLFHLFAALALVAAAATWIGAATRLGRVVNPTPWQSRANLISLATAALWLVSAIAMATYVVVGGKSEDALYVFPGGILATASWAGLLASIGTVLLVLTLPLAWAGGGWSVWRKLRHTLAAVLFAAFAIFAAAWGLLLPWA